MTYQEEQIAKNGPDPCYWDIEKCPDGTDHTFMTPGMTGLCCTKCDVSLRMVYIRRSGVPVDSLWNDGKGNVRADVLRRCEEARNGGADTPTIVGG